MPALLVALNGAPDIRLSGLLTIAGRHPDCDSRLDSSRVSRRHCCLAVGDGEVLVRDLGSTNGTRVNGHRIEEGVLRPGDVLEIAHLRFRLVQSDPARSSPPVVVSRGNEPDPATLTRECGLRNGAPRPGPPSEDARHGPRARPGGAERIGGARGPRIPPRPDAPHPGPVPGGRKCHSERVAREGCENPPHAVCLVRSEDFLDDHYLLMSTTEEPAQVSRRGRRRRRALSTT